MKKKKTGRKNTEKMLLLSEERKPVINECFQGLLASSSVVIYTAAISSDYETTFVTENISKMTGYESRLFIEDPQFRLSPIHPDDKARLFLKLSKVLDEGYSYNEYRFRHRNGSYLWICDEMTVIKDPEGEPMEIIGSMTDITKIKKMERESARGERNLFSLMELHKRNFISVEEIFDFVLKEALKCTESKFSFIGLMSEEKIIAHFFSKEALSDCHPENITKNLGNYMAAFCDDVVRDKYPNMINDFKHEREDYKKKYLQASFDIERLMCIPVFDGKKLVAVGSVANKGEDYDDMDLRAMITLLEEMWQLIKNMRAMGQLKESEERFRSFVQVSPSPVFATDLNGNLTYWSRRLSDLMGISDGEAMGKGWEKCLHPDDSDLTLKELKGVIRNKVDYKSEHRFVTADKRVLWGLLQLSPIKLAKGKVSGFVGTITEITEKILAEKEMEARLDELERFRRATVQREFRMKELKEENLLLREKLVKLRSKEMDKGI